MSENEMQVNVSRSDREYNVKNQKMKGKKLQEMCGLLYWL